MRCSVPMWMRAREVLEDGKGVIQHCSYSYADENPGWESLVIMFTWANYSKSSAGLMCVCLCVWKRERGMKRKGCSYLLLKNQKEFSKCLLAIPSLIHTLPWMVLKIHCFLPMESCNFTVLWSRPWLMTLRCKNKVIKICYMSLLPIPQEFSTN